MGSRGCRVIVVLAGLMFGGCSSSASSSGPPTAAASSTTQAGVEAVGFAARATRVVADVAAGHVDAVTAQFDATMTASLTADGLRQAWTAYQVTFGAFRSQGQPELVSRPPNTVVNIPLTMATMPGQARITFGPAGKIAGLFFLKTGIPVP